jgi:hypothetical protein
MLLTGDFKTDFNKVLETRDFELLKQVWRRAMPFGFTYEEEDKLKEVFGENYEQDLQAALSAKPSL